MAERDHTHGLGRAGPAVRLLLVRLASSYCWPQARRPEDYVVHEI